MRSTAFAIMMTASILSPLALCGQASKVDNCSAVTEKPKKNPCGETRKRSSPAKPQLQPPAKEEPNIIIENKLELPPDSSAQLLAVFTPILDKVVGPLNKFSDAAIMQADTLDSLSSLTLEEKKPLVIDYAKKKIAVQDSLAKRNNAEAGLIDAQADVAEKESGYGRILVRGVLGIGQAYAGHTVIKTTYSNSMIGGGAEMNGSGNGGGAQITGSGNSSIADSGNSTNQNTNKATGGKTGPVNVTTGPVTVTDTNTQSQTQQQQQQQQADAKSSASATGTGGSGGAGGAGGKGGSGGQPGGGKPGGPKCDPKHPTGGGKDPGDGGGDKDHKGGGTDDGKGNDYHNNGNGNHDPNPPSKGKGKH